jgi:protein-S-isoprenylcysteine O-methyltransferase Ste14
MGVPGDLYWRIASYTLYLIKKDPALLERRMSGGPTAEKVPAQKVIMLFASIGFIGLLIVPALDHRFGWSIVPLPLVIAGDTLVAIGFYFIFLVYRENTFTSGLCRPLIRYPSEANLSVIFRSKVE